MRQWAESDDEGREAVGCLALLRVLRDARLWRKCVGSDKKSTPRCYSPRERKQRTEKSKCQH